MIRDQSKLGSAAEHAFTQLLSYFYELAAVSHETPDLGIDRTVRIPVPWSAEPPIELHFQIKIWPKNGTISTGQSPAVSISGLAANRIREWYESPIPTFLVVMKPPPANASESEFLSQWDAYIEDIESYCREHI